MASPDHRHLFPDHESSDTPTPLLDGLGRSPRGSSYTGPSQKLSAPNDRPINDERRRSAADASVTLQSQLRYNWIVVDNVEIDNEEALDVLNRIAQPESYGKTFGDVGKSEIKKEEPHNHDSIEERRNVVVVGREWRFSERQYQTDLPPRDGLCYFKFDHGSIFHVCSFIKWDSSQQGKPQDEIAGLRHDRRKEPQKESSSQHNSTLSFIRGGLSRRPQFHGDTTQHTSSSTGFIFEWRRWLSSAFTSTTTNDKHNRKRKGRGPQTSYYCFLRPSRYWYDPRHLDDPRFRQGVHHTLMHLEGCHISIIPFVNPQKLKEERNQQFRNTHPQVPKSMTLSKLRSLKEKMFGLLAHGAHVSLELSTIACAWVYLERLVTMGLVDKSNRKVKAAACFMLAYKFNNEVEDSIQLKEFAQMVLRVLDDSTLTPNRLFLAEFTVYAELEFSLMVELPHIRPHLEDAEAHGQLE
eukprot:GHVN01015710.1.p1 GENE.GHVN01015710.1~~GHVN01015710.1.p1  ORF type:complete len:466 (-),score=55.07 GHVN01015710.1:1227-2624(-)